MPFDARVFTVAKDVEFREDFQDACQLDAAHGVAAIADGVTSSLFAGLWANLLTTAVVADPPDPTDAEPWGRWLAQQRSRWAEQIDISNLNWFQKAKLQQGAFSTLLWITLTPRSPAAADGEPAYRLRAFAIGDTCLLHLRNGQLLRAFPLDKAEQFDADPLVVGSLDLSHDGLLKFAALDEPCAVGDLLLLCTDAVAAWAIAACQAGDPPAWDRCWEQTDLEWQVEIVEMRQRRQIRCDDSTLVLLRVVQETEKQLPDEAPPAPVDATVSVELPAKKSPDLHVERPAKPQAEPETVPAPLAVSPLERLAETIGNVSEQVSEQVADGMLRGFRRLRDLALRKYREKFPPKDE